MPIKDVKNIIQIILKKEKNLNNINNVNLILMKIYIFLKKYNEMVNYWVFIN